MANLTQGTNADKHIKKRSVDLNRTYYEETGYDIDSELEKERLLDTAYHNYWYRWAEYTAKQSRKNACIFCAPSPLQKLTIVPNQYDFRDCARFYSQYCHMPARSVPYCPAKCLKMLGNPYYQKFYYQMGWGDECKNLDVKIDPRKRETPKNYVLDRSLEYECFNKTKGYQNMGQFKGKCAVIWHLDREMYNNPNVYRSSSIIYATATVSKNMTIIEPYENCENATLNFPLIEPLENQSEAIADYFWLCGGRRLRATLKEGWKGLCTRVRLAQAVGIIDWDPNEEDSREIDQSTAIRQRVKRAYIPDPNVKIDEIGQPRGIPHEFKARDEVLSGIESIFVWITPNKNVEWINYIYYNQQRFINYTDDALAALGEQLKYTSKMTWQNRQALDWLLAEKGVCAYCLELTVVLLFRITQPLMDHSPRP